MSHEARTFAALEWAFRDIEGDALDAFAGLKPPRRKALPAGSDFWDRASEEARWADCVARWESDIGAVWLHLFAWLEAYWYARVSLAAPTDAERRTVFTDAGVQREIRREARRLLCEIMG